MTTWDDETDVIVAGTGGGLAGAYTAAREGLSVVVVEASDQFGGTTAYSGGGGMWFPCNPVLRRAGCDDTLDAAFAYFHAAVGDRTPVELQCTYVYGGTELIAYLEEDDHFEFDVLPWPDYYGRLAHARLDGLRHTVMKPLAAERLGELAQRVRGPLDRERLGAEAPEHLIGGRALVGRLLSAITTYPHASLHLNSPLVELVTSDDGVVGAVVEHDGRRRAVRAHGGVLLAAGGFENNPELRQRFGVPGDARDTMGAPGNLGRALEAALAARAAIDLMDQVWWSPGLTHPDGRSAFSLWFTGGIFVNQDGKRFVNESGPYDRIGNAIIDQIACGAMTLPFWMIYDDRDGRVPPVKATNVSMVEPERYVEAGLWHTADTLPELAARIGVNAENLVSTVKRFNEFVAAGVDDDFGRGDEAYDRAFSGGQSPMVPIDTAPYHAAAFGLSDLGTKGGLVTDSHARVLDTDGNPINGLYAAGNTMAAVSGTVYPGAATRSARRCCSATSPPNTWPHHGAGQTADISAVSRKYRGMASLQRYTDRRVLITGGGSGIGQASVIRILDEGGRVVAADISESGLKDTVARAEPHGDRLTTLVMDVGNEASVQTGVGDAVRELGGLDTLVNAAGILRSVHFLETTLADFEQVLRINLIGTFLVTREAIPSLRNGNDSAVVNFSSTSAAFAHPYMSAYAASKGGIQAMTHALALEFAKEGIRFNSVQPGSISSGMTDGTGESKQSIGPGLPADADFSLFGKITPVLPLDDGGMFAKPDAVAAVVAMLGSSDAYFVTGTEVRIDGGTHM